jgi:glycosyltransferase involved in cell wall biosynthesis
MKMKDPYISILIPTYDRSNKLKTCLLSILKNSFIDYEVLILDQSKNNLSERCVASFHNKRIRYVKLNFLGKSKALNQGAALSKGNILVFTDDDCIADPKWLDSINNFYLNHPTVSGVFGKTLPYQPKKHRNLICPATFQKNNELFTSNPKDIFYTTLGQGNNMSYRKNMFLNLRGMNEKFGPGAIISTAEDCQFIYHALINKYILAYHPKILMYHDRWISYTEERLLQATYTLGICACVSNYIIHFRDTKILSLFRYRYHEYIGIKIKQLFSLIIRGKIRAFWRQKSEIVFIMRQIIALCWGLILGVIV